MACRVTSFAEITGDTVVQQALQQAYGSVDTIDLWVAGLAEKHLLGSSLGPTFTRIIVDQFTRLRDGDRFWYQNVLPAAVVQLIQNTTLADVIRRNTQVSNLQSDVFVFRASIQGNVFSDANRDGIRQRREAGLSSVSVNLVDASGAVVATSQTNRNGEYVFSRLDLGSYRVVVTPSGGTVVSSRTVTVTRGGEIRGIDVGIPTNRVRSVLRRSVRRGLQPWGRWWRAFLPRNTQRLR